MEIVGILPFLLGFAGFAIGSFVVLTMRASAIRRLMADAVVLLAAVIGVGLVIVGVVGPLLGLAGAFLIPVLTSVGLRHLWTTRPS